MNFRIYGNAIRKWGAVCFTFRAPPPPSLSIASQHAGGQARARAGGRLGAVHDSSNVIHRSVRYCGAHCVAGRPHLFLTSEHGRMRRSLGPRFSRRKALARSGSSGNIAVLVRYCAVTGCLSTDVPRLLSSLYVCLSVCLHLKTGIPTGHVLVERYTGMAWGSSLGIGTLYWNGLG